MTMVIPMASHRAVPTAPKVNAVHLMSRIGTFNAPAPNVDADHVSAATAESDLVHLHMAAVNALSHALRQLTGPDCSPAMWASATARAHRGLTALKRASALVNQVEG